MNFVTKLATSVAIGAGVMLAPAAALAYYPYTYFTGQNYFNGGGGFYAEQPNYYGSSNCNAYYGCGSIGYNAMTGQWSNGGLMGGGSNYGYGGYGGYGMGYGQIGGSYAGGGIGNYMQYIPANARQYVQMGYGGYGGGYGGYNNGYNY